MGIKQMIYGHDLFLPIIPRGVFFGAVKRIIPKQMVSPA
jgi:hypothetical protein